jgi:hypothetical protein
MEHDWSAARGVPAHVTVLFPFAAGADVDEVALAELFAERPSFAFTLERVETRGGMVWLLPEPSRPFEELTQAVWRRWPEYPPYEGAHETVVPHLTVSETPIEVDLQLPIASRAGAVTLLEEQPNGTWTTRAAFSLAQHQAVDPLRRSFVEPVRRAVLREQVEERL